MAALRSLGVVFTLVLLVGVEWDGGGGAQFGEFVDAGAEFLLDVADAVILCQSLGLAWLATGTYNRAGLPRSWLVLLCVRPMV